MTLKDYLERKGLDGVLPGIDDRSATVILMAAALNLSCHPFQLPCYLYVQMKGSIHHEIGRAHV